MADAKQANLSGAYYGPPIPPQNTYRSVGRSSGCNPCACLFCTLFKLIFSIVVILGIIVLVVWLVIRPYGLKAHAESAALTQFALSSSNTLDFNLTVDIAVRNRNKRIGIYYDYIESQAFYDGDRFGFELLPPFYQGHKTTSEIKPAFQGTQLMLGNSVSTTYNTEKGKGFYNVDVKVYTKLRLKIWIFKIHHVNPTIKCTLSLPVPSNTSSTSTVNLGTDCDVDY
ncbi:NDR1/HIN1-like protein 10 [Ananas comosus]|uniref:NDR1/HIN1-like protein 10 n=1 Tax=Ananas comosus TaxID=4615 RepID=A0A6P5EB91_ANACO|nr:NDR1/HIN1-like protein 10 [Ananas comosus]